MITYELEAKQIFEELLGTLTLLLYVSVLKIMHNGEIAAMKRDMDDFIATFYKLRVARAFSLATTEEEKQVMLKALNVVVDEFKKGVCSTLDLSTYKEASSVDPIN